MSSLTPFESALPDALPAHPAAKLLPGIPDTEQQELTADILKNGLQHPIVLFWDFSEVDQKDKLYILDGRHRYRACQNAMVTPRCVLYTGQDPYGFVMSENLFRRHLEKSQRAMIAAELANRPHGVTRYANSHISVPTVPEAAKLLNISASAVIAGRKVLEVAEPETIADVKSGKTTLHAASFLAELPRDTQLAVSGSSTREIKAMASEVRKAKEEGRPVEIDKETKKVLYSLYRDVKSEDQAKQEAKREEKRQVNMELIKTSTSQGTKLEDLKQVFSTILLDPPWEYADVGLGGDPTGRTRPDYQTMGFEEIKKLPVGRLAAPDSHVWLWIPDAFLRKGYELLEAWGFTGYTKLITWVKTDGIGLGANFRPTTEFVLFAKRGESPLKRKNAPTHFEARRGPNGHSSKPPETYDFIESCSPGPYLEMFSRAERLGWHSWGQDGVRYAQELSVVE